MTATSDNAELADRLARRRARMMPVLALFLIFQQLSYFSQGDGTRLVDHVRIGGWVAMSLVILLVLTTGGFWLRKPEVRILLEDEGTRANRASALRIGYICAMLTAIACYVGQSLWTFSMGEVIHLIVTAGLISAALRFSVLERRALG